MRVLISGYLGLGNLGDEALFAGLADGLRRAGHEPVALSAAPAATRRLHGVEAHHRLAGLPRALLRCDALVSGGGGLLQDVTSARSLRYYLAVIRFARAAGKRVAVFGQSLGPLSEAGRRSVGRALRDLPVGVRDAPSERLARELGLTPTRVADTALVLPARAPRAEPDAHGAVVLIPRVDVPGQEAALRAAAAWAHGDGRPVRVLALQSGPDRAFAERFAAETPAVRVLDATDPYRAAALCGAADRVASVRLHGLVFAARAGVAHVGAAYDPKVAGFADRSGAATVAVPIDPDAWVRAVRDARPPAPERVRALRAEAEAGLGWLDAALHGRAHPTGAEGR